MVNRELDAIVAEKVMGIGNTFLSRCNDPGETAYLDDQGLYRLVPHYSTDIAAAWGVVERMRDDDWRVDLWVDEDGWWVRFTRFLQVGYECADTAPEAICRAALKAMEADNGISQKSDN